MVEVVKGYWSASIGKFVDWTTGVPVTGINFSKLTSQVDDNIGRLWNETLIEVIICVANRLADSGIDLTRISLLASPQIDAIMASSVLYDRLSCNGLRLSSQKISDVLLPDSIYFEDSADGLIVGRVTVLDLP